MENVTPDDEELDLHEREMVPLGWCIISQSSGIWSRDNARDLNETSPLCRDLQV
jgi:hypothetical protein